MPPYDNMRIEVDSTVAHTGRKSVRCSGPNGMVRARAGVCQVVCDRRLGGRRVKFSGYVKTDSLVGSAYLKIYAHTLSGVVKIPGSDQYDGTRDWTLASMEADLPADTYAIWCWFQYSVPAAGRVYFDDFDLAVVGSAAPPPKSVGARKR